MKVPKSLTVLCLVVVFCAKATRAEESSEDEDISPLALQGILMSAYMDETAEPCDDFYQYACGNFENVNPRLGGMDVAGIARAMHHVIDDLLIEILESEKATDNELERKVKQFYKTCVNSDLFNFRKSDTLEKLIKSWGGFPAVDPDWSESESDFWKLNAEIAALDMHGLTIDKDERNMPALRLMPFGIYDSHDFRKNNTKNNKINIVLMKKLMIMYGAPIEHVDAAVDGILEFGETYQKILDHNLQTIFLHNSRRLCREEPIMCDLIKIVYNSEHREPFQLSWDPRITRVWGFLNGYYDKKSVYNYLILRALAQFHQELDKPKYIKSFCVNQARKSFQYATSFMFFNNEHYNKNVEQEIMTMTENIRKQFIESIKSHDWLDQLTKERAIDKITNIKIFIGTPFENLKNWDFLTTIYKNVTLTSDHFSNVLSAKRNFRSLLNEVGRSRLEEFSAFLHDSMEAAYIRSMNAIILTAGALLPPLYFTGMPKAYNYAAIGSTIAHEFTHALDGKAGESQLNWEQKSLINFHQRLSCIEDYFSNFVMEDIHAKVDGALTRAENVADSGGIRHAYYAFQNNSETDHVDLKNDILSYLGLNENQFFFLSTAQLWCHSFSRKVALRAKEDEHTHDKYRVIGTLAHFKEFGNAFNCPVGSNMNVEEKCEIW